VEKSSQQVSSHSIRIFTATLVQRLLICNSPAQIAIILAYIRGLPLNPPPNASNDSIDDFTSSYQIRDCIFSIKNQNNSNTSELNASIIDKNQHKEQDKFRCATA